MALTSMVNKPETLSVLYEKIHRKATKCRYCEGLGGFLRDLVVLLGDDASWRGVRIILSPIVVSWNSTIPNQGLPGGDPRVLKGTL